MDQHVQSQGVHSCDQRSTPVTSLALDQRVTSISHSQDQGVLQLGQRIQQLDQRVQRLGQGVQSWLQSPQLRLTSTREQAVPAADQGVIEPGAQQSGQRHTQLSKTVLPFPLNSRRMKAVYLRRVADELGLPSNATATDLRQIVEGKLREMGHEPGNLQVAVEESPTVETLQLLNAYGPIIEVRHDKPTQDLEEETDYSAQSHSSLPSSEADQELLEQVQTLREERDELQEQVTQLQEKLEAEKQRVQELWQGNCEQNAQLDLILQDKDAEIAELREQLAALNAHTPAPPLSQRKPDSSKYKSPRGATKPDSAVAPMGILLKELESQPPPTRRGKAPPVDPFTGENPAIRAEDWFPSLERTANWNGWNSEELLIQLAGHLRGKALMEWNLLEPDDKATYKTAKQALQARLDPGGRSLAAQDFRHMMQQETESVSDFIQRLERIFQIAYGRDQMLKETRDTLLHSQLQEGLRDELMRSPTVSGAQTYLELCLAAKNEEKRLASLKKRQQYHHAAKSSDRKQEFPSKQNSSPNPQKNVTRPRSTGCYICGKQGHMAKECRKRNQSTESKGFGQKEGNKKDSAAKQVQSSGTEKTDPRDLLLSDSSEEEDSTLKQVRVDDKGSHAQCVKVTTEGVPMYGIVDTGADITIMGGTMFRKVAAVAKLRKKDFKNPDKQPKTYDQRTFTLDGMINMEIKFKDKVMKTPVYIKMDAHDQLLLSEGLCRQLGIVSYDPAVQVWRGGKQAKLKQEKEETISTVQVRLLQSVQILPQQSLQVDIQLLPEGKVPTSTEQLVLVEPTPTLKTEMGIVMEDSLLNPAASGLAQVVLMNSTGFTQLIEAGTELGTGEAATIVEPAAENDDITSLCNINKLSSGATDRKRRDLLLEYVGQPDLPESERTKLIELIQNHHELFALEEGERGQTDLVEMEIDTGDSHPIKQPARRMPFAVRREVARQVQKMQESGIVVPSNSPWSSPVVMVRKKDGTHRFCVDYRRLNATTKADQFPIPRTDDLLDQLGKSKYFSTLDLASGYWQIPVHPDSQAKTAFTTPSGLYEFKVMPFGLTNAPAVFQRLMQRVLMGLNPPEGPDMVTVYIDDILVFSRTLDEHLQHLQSVLQRLKQAGLKLNPQKCHFITQEVEYLGHIITPDGLKTNPRLVEAVVNFPTPKSVQQVRQFLGLSSFYRRFIPNFAKIAQPLHTLTRKSVQFVWDSDCQTAFDHLKQKLTQAPILSYPSFDHPYILETDASIQGLGAILSQEQDGRIHPVAYASRSLSPQERNYGITELETLAVVWAISHFKSYLYGNSVTVYTDHSAIKAILETPSPTGKHARWWTKVYGSGVNQVHIVHRSGKANTNADALSRNPLPQGPDALETICEGEIQVAAIRSTDDANPDISTLLSSNPATETESIPFSTHQRKDSELTPLILFIEEKKLPDDANLAKKIAAQATQFAIVDRVLYFLDPRRNHKKRVVVPKHLQEQLIQEHHRGNMGGHFAANKLYRMLASHWWWEGMYSDVYKKVKSCPECAIVSGGGRKHKPPLHPIPVQRPFQIIGVDIMELPKTRRGNRYVVVFQDFFSKWPMVYPVPDQKAERLVKLLAEEVIPFCGVPEALLSDRGANLLSHLMTDVCEMLGIHKLNTTSYHPQCDGMVERFNRTLKSALRKHAVKFGNQWDTYLPGIVYAYRNSPHDSTGEKPSFLLFGFDCRSPSEAALMEPEVLQPTDVSDYREQLVLSLTSARDLATQSIRKAQNQYKSQYDKKSTKRTYQVGDWVLVKFPAEESGKNRKLSQPWHGPYRVLSCPDPDIVVSKVYFPDDGQIQVHQLRVTPCPVSFPSGYYWYGRKKHSPGCMPKWLLTLNKKDDDTNQADHEQTLDTDPDCSDSEEDSSNNDSDSESDDEEIPQQHSRYNLRQQTVRPQRLMYINARVELP